jgi:hypothetical protein
LRNASGGDGVRGTGIMGPSLEESCAVNHRKQKERRETSPDWGTLEQKGPPKVCGATALG